MIARLHQSIIVQCFSKMALRFILWGKLSICWRRFSETVISKGLWPPRHSGLISPDIYSGSFLKKDYKEIAQEVYRKWKWIVTTRTVTSHRKLSGSSVETSPGLIMHALGTVEDSDVVLCEHNAYLMLHEIWTGARGSVVGWGTVLKVERLRVRDPTRSLIFFFFNLPTSSARTMPWGSLSHLTEMIIRTENSSFYEVDHGRCVELKILPLSVSRLSKQCGILNISQSSTACYGDSFIVLYVIRTFLFVG
jgi:hypothetical protein